MVKNSTKVYLFLLLIAIAFGCDKDNLNPEARALCETEGGQIITDAKGRIYRSISEPHFYYIGNPIQVTTGINGGYIPCNGLPKNFQQEGLIVIYSGIDKGSLSDTGDPLYGYLSLSKIEKR